MILRHAQAGWICAAERQASRPLGLDAEHLPPGLVHVDGAKVRRAHADHVGGRFEHRGEPSPFGFGPLAGRNVAQDQLDAVDTADRDPGGEGFDLDQGAVEAARDRLDSLDLAALEQASGVRLELAAQRWQGEPQRGLAKQRRPIGSAEEIDRARVGEGDPAALDDDDAVGRSLDQPAVAFLAVAQRLLGLPARGDVAGRTPIAAEPA